MRGRDFLVTSADDGHVIVCEIVNAAFSHVSHEREAVLKTRCSTLVHISNTKCLTLTPSLAGNDDVIVFSGGGRAQLLVSVLTCGKFLFLLLWGLSALIFDNSFRYWALFHFVSL